MTELAKIGYDRTTNKWFTDKGEFDSPQEAYQSVFELTP